VLRRREGSNFAGEQAKSWGQLPRSFLCKMLNSLLVNSTFHQHTNFTSQPWTEKLGRSSKESPIYAFVICESERLTGWSLSRKDAQTGISNKAWCTTGSRLVCIQGKHLRHIFSSTCIMHQASGGQVDTSRCVVVWTSNCKRTKGDHIASVFFLSGNAEIANSYE